MSQQDSQLGTEPTDPCKWVKHLLIKAYMTTKFLA